MTANRRKESEVDEQYTTEESPIEEEFDDNRGPTETGRNVAVGAGISASLIVAIGFVVLAVVLLGYIIANAL